MRVYLDNCCYNRLFDDQRDLATAKEIKSAIQADAAIASLLRKG